MIRSFFIGILIGGILTAGWWFTHRNQTPVATNLRATQTGVNALVSTQPTSISTSASNEAYINRTNDSVYATRSNAITRAVAIATPAVVGVNVTAVREQLVRMNPFNDPFFSGLFPPEVVRQRIESIGSGFLISYDGYILTADHVVENATEIVITLVGGKQENARLIGTDKVSDVALLKINGSNLPFVRLSDSRDILVGEWAIAMGNPFGLFNNNVKPSVSVGVVSTIGQDFDRNSEGRVYRDMIQTDAAINSGNSGGPLLNALGEVIGMNTMIYTPVQNRQGVGPSAGVGFAIPANRLKATIEVLKKGKSLNRDFNTGMHVQNLDPQIIRSLRLKAETKGVIVADVDRGSPADKAGIQPSDILIAMDEYEISDVPSVRRALDRLDLKVGDLVKLKLLRDGSERSVQMRLEAFRK